MVRTKQPAKKTTGGKAPLASYQRPVTGSRMSVEPSPGVRKPKGRKQTCKTRFTQKKTRHARTRKEPSIAVDNARNMGLVAEGEVEETGGQPFDNNKVDRSNGDQGSEESKDKGNVESSTSERSTTETSMDYSSRWPGYSGVIPSFDDYIPDVEEEEKEC